MRRALIAVTGLLLAFLVALSTLSVLLAAEAATLAPPTSIDLMRLTAWAGAALVSGGGTLLWVCALALCFAPVALVGLIGEACRLRGLVWYAGGTGGLTAAVPTLARSALNIVAHPSAASVEGRLTLILFLAGVSGGFVYWLIAGRTASGS